MISVPSSTLTGQITGLSGPTKCGVCTPLSSISLCESRIHYQKGATRSALGDTRSFSLSSSAHTTGPEIAGIRD
jgi:hypothetical protein